MIGGSKLEDLLGVLIGLVALLIPIVAILTRHQQRMAELLRGSQPQLQNDQVEQLRREISDLRQVVHQQTIALDSASSGRLQPPTVPTVDLPGSVGEGTRG